MLPVRSKLAEHVVDGGTITCTMILSFKSVIEQLQSKNRAVGLQALRDLQRIGYRADNETITAVILSLEANQTDAGLCRAVLEVLAAVATRGDSAASSVAESKLSSRDGVVRRAALEALGKVAPSDSHPTMSGDAHVIHRIANCLNDVDEAVKRAAQNALVDLI